MGPSFSFIFAPLREYLKRVKNLFSPRNEKALREFLATDPLLGFDYDGTLAPIVTDPLKAQLRPRTRRLLRQLCEKYTCVLLTGRERMNALERLQGIPFAEVLGNHGAEWGKGSKKADILIARTAGWHAQLEATLCGLQGVFIENKRLSLSVHYR